MSDIPNGCNALIVTPDPGFFHAKLTFVPRVGELLHFTSFVEQRQKKQSVFHFEVVQVVHHMYEVDDELDDDGNQKHKGSQFLHVHVKPTKSRFFD